MMINMTAQPIIEQRVQHRANMRRLDEPDRTKLQELVERHNVADVARAAGVSIQSLVKAISGVPLLKSTLNRVRSVLPR